MRLTLDAPVALTLFLVSFFSSCFSFCSFVFLDPRPTSCSTASQSPSPSFSMTFLISLPNVFFFCSYRSPNDTCSCAHHSGDVSLSFTCPHTRSGKRISKRILKSVPLSLSLSPISHSFPHTHRSSSVEHTDTRHNPSRVRLTCWPGISEQGNVNEIVCATVCTRAKDDCIMCSHSTRVTSEKRGIKQWLHQQQQQQQ